MIDNLSKLPEISFYPNTFHVSGPHGEPSVIAIKRGEAGYFPIYTASTADELNEAKGVTPAQAEAMLAGSMFGWDVPAANPDRYNEAGKAITKRMRQEAE